LAILVVSLFLINSCKKDTKNNNGPVDFDGNHYQTVKIGTQVWMSENLKVTHYRNGDPIQYVNDGNAWKGLTTGAYCNNSISDAAANGNLYNWYAVNDIRKLAPVGWHVASYDEWTLMINYLGGADKVAGKLKEAGTAHWKGPNTESTNSSGFTALPNTYREPDGPDVIFDFCYFWTSTATSDGYAWSWVIAGNSIVTYPFNATFKNTGITVRCIKD
jgi:uncharacterized protein (TIGR02145 family)